jgi:transketolase
MRNILSSALLPLCGQPDFVFLTGDLGFMALEPVQAAAGPRFINAGVAEQNMVSVAAGLAREGLRPWVYSIAPFLYARPFEQIRNDVCLHNLPVTLVGNGGGYAYGVMGATHHALEDYGALTALAHLTAYVPAFAEDVPAAIARIEAARGPAYLRLGRDEKPKGLVLPPYAPWRRVLPGGGPAMLIVGPLAGGIIDRLSSLPERERPSVWVLTELPIDPAGLPEVFLADVRRADHLFVIEEHVAQGGVGSMLAHALLLRGCAPRRFTHRCARGYPSGRYGSQKYHRKESGLDPESIVADLAAAMTADVPGRAP